MNVLPVIALVAALSFAVPQVGDIVFKWIPAAASVVVGAEMPGDVRYTESGEPVRELMVALRPLSDTRVAASRGDDRALQAASAASAFDVAMDFGAGVAYAQSPQSEVAARGAHLWTTFVPLSIFFSLLLVVGIVYSLLQLMRIREAERAALSVEEHPVEGGDTTKAQLRFKKILEHANTENESDWRHAIIEADIMLDELLTAQGYHGDTLGDKLKQVERSDFNTIDLAWEAHKVRNRIAHDGSAHSLNAREARRVVALYEQVLHEFHFI